MNLTIITPPPFEPVTLAQVYAHLRLDPEGSPMTHADDAMLLRHIESARRHVEQMARRSLVQQSLRLSLATFPVSYDAWALGRAPRDTVREVRLISPPLVAVDAVRYYDGDNALQTLDAANYYVTDEQVPQLRFVPAFSAPTLYDRPDAVRIDYRAGYAPEGSPPETQADYVANVPKPLLDAVLLGVQLLYDELMPAQREQIERTREAIVQPYRVQLA